MKHHLAGTVALLLTAGAFAQQPTPELIEAINAYRVAPQSCEGQRTAAALPLVANPVLASAPFAPGGRLLEALKAHGYSGVNAYAIVVSGSATAADALSLVAERYCTQLTSPLYTEIGVRRERNQWQIVLARPQLSSDLKDWRATGREILRLTNAARAQPRMCGDRRFDVARPLTWDEKLATAALAHSLDMASRNYLDHAGPDRSEPADRALRAGYKGMDIGENIAGGQESPAQVVSGWIASPEHCATLMDPKFLHMGAAYFANPHSDLGMYWTQVLGRAW
jgi:uncharacterized protein YkwD